MGLNKRVFIVARRYLISDGERASDDHAIGIAQGFQECFGDDWIKVISGEWLAADFDFDGISMPG